MVCQRRAQTAVVHLESLRVGTGVGHGEQTRLRVLELEVLVRKLLAVDGLATRALS